MTPQSANAAESLLLDTSNGTFSLWAQNAGMIYLNKVTGTPGTLISTIKSGWASNISAEASNTTVYIFTDVSGAPGSVAATFAYASNDGANWATFTGSYNVPAGGTFFIGQRATARISNAGGNIANQAGTTWSITYTSRYSGNSLSGPFTNDPVNTAPVWRIYGVNLTTLATPANPILTSTSTTITASETSTDINASNYLVRIFQSNGTTLVESRTVSSSTILSGVSFSGLSVNTQYKVGVTALGNGSTHADSAMSNLSTISTTLASSSVVTTVVGNPTIFSYRTTYQLRASVSGSTGFVTFKANGKQIPGCNRVNVSGSVADCSWKPSLHGEIIVRASFTSTNANYSSAEAPPFSVKVVARTNRR